MLQKSWLIDKGLENFHNPMSSPENIVLPDTAEVDLYIIYVG